MGARWCNRSIVMMDHRLEDRSLRNLQRQRKRVGTLIPFSSPSLWFSKINLKRNIFRQECSQEKISVAI